MLLRHSTSKKTWTLLIILKKILAYWPWPSSMKQILMLDELEEIMEIITFDLLEKDDVGDV